MRGGLVNAFLGFCERRCLFSSVILAVGCLVLGLALVIQARVPHFMMHQLSFVWLSCDASCQANRGSFG